MLKFTKDLEKNKINDILFKQIAILMYLTTIKLDIMYYVSHINKYMESSKQSYIQVAKRILWCLKGIADFGFFYKKEKKSCLIGFLDIDYAGDMDDQKNITGYILCQVQELFHSFLKHNWLSLCQQQKLLQQLTFFRLWLRRILEELLEFFVTIDQPLNCPRILCYMEEVSILMLNIIF